MSAPGRPKSEYRRAQHAGCLMSSPGRPKGHTAVRSTEVT